MPPMPLYASRGPPSGTRRRSTPCAMQRRASSSRRPTVRTVCPQNTQPVAPLAHILLGVVREGALFLATAEDPAAAQRDVGQAVDRILLGLSGAAGGGA